MLKLAKYLKPFIGPLVLAVAMLFVQAVSELSLPNYMSRIVNVGIQQGGIEDAAPSAISREAMALMQAFMSADEKALAEQSYTLAAADANVYTSMAGTDIWLRNTKAAPELNTAFSNAAFTLVTAAQSAAGAAGGDTAESDVLDLSAVSTLAPGLDAEQIANARTAAMASDEQLRKQSGIAAAKAVYNQLGMDTAGMQTGYIIRVGAIMLGISLLGVSGAVMVGLLSSQIGTAVARNLRHDVFRKVEDFSNGEFDKFSTASLITRSTNDVTQIQTVLTMGVRMLFYPPIMATGSIFMAVSKSPSMSWILALASIVLICMVVTIFSVAMPKFKIIQKLIDRVNLVAREGLNGLMVIRAFGAEKHETNRFDKANTELTDVNLFVNRVMVFMMPAMTLIMNGTMLMVVWVGAHHIAQSSMQVGDMMAFMQYAMHVVMSFLFISMMFIFVPRASVSADRIAEVLNTGVSVLDPEKPETFPSGGKGLVEFRDVSFRYQNAEDDVLQNISFTAKPGETTAIIGSTGSGKSTLANMLLRFYDVISGQVLIDGVDVRRVTQKDLRGRIGYVPQKAVLISGTIASNLRYGSKDAPDDLIAAAADVAQAMEFINEKPEKFDTAISQGGTNVSGGQKQRLSIARALAKKPEIFLFDDSFSALDYRTDVVLRKALKAYTGGSTVIIIAQRIGTILDADQIIVLDSGRVVGRGKHAELLKNCPEYFEIASSQLSGEELQRAVSGFEGVLA